MSIILDTHVVNCIQVGMKHLSELMLYLRGLLDYRPCAGLAML